MYGQNCVHLRSIHIINCCMCLHEKVSVVEKLCILTDMYKLNHTLPRSGWTFNTLTTASVISGKSITSQIAGISRHHFAWEEDQKKLKWKEQEERSKTKKNMWL